MFKLDNRLNQDKPQRPLQYQFQIITGIVLLSIEWSLKMS